MKKSLTKIFIALSIMLTGAFGLVAPTFAADPCDQPGLTPEVQQALGCSTDSASDLSVVIQNILTAIIGAAGIIAVIFIVIGGVQYMTSTGDSAKVEKAKKTILYAVIGLIICALAFAIVNWAIALINNA